MNPSEVSTVCLRELLAETERCLVEAKRAGALAAENPAREARWMLEHASGFEGAEFLLALDELAKRRTVSSLDAMLARRLAGEPLQYVLGRWAFRSLDVMVDRRVLIPRPETEQVVEVAIGELLRSGGDDRPTTVVDLGTGSGVIALSIAVEVTRSQVWAIDRSTEALEVARANLAGLGRAAERVRLATGDWFEALGHDLRGKIDLIVANPPYVAEHEVAVLPAGVIDWEPTQALVAGPSGLEDLCLIIHEAPHWLTTKGALVIECAPHQVPQVADIASASGFNEVEIFNDLADRPRGLLARLAH